MSLYLPTASETLSPFAMDLNQTPAAFRKAIEISRKNWEIGSLTVTLPSGQVVRIEGVSPGPHGHLIVNDFRFVGRVLASADIGFGEGYMAGEWDTPNLSLLLQAFTLNFDRLAGLATGNRLMSVVHFLTHLFNANSRKGSRRNIYAHYDLGNAFYSKWLDTSMTYSAAKYEYPGQELAEAQKAKYARLAHDLNLQSGHSVLEVGCGWGGFTEFAAKEVGARVTAVTISPAQHEYARKRLFDLGLADRADIQLKDYRDVTGSFDRVASIEMFEAVGEAYWPVFFAKLRDVLAPGGRAGLQIITIRDDLFSIYRKRSDFMRKYIFPGGMLAGERQLRQQTDLAGLGWNSITRFGLDYADTLAAWAHRFETAWDEICPLGFDERFRRLWRFYLSYCEAGFRSARTDVVQLSLSRQ